MRTVLEKTVEKIKKLTFKEINDLMEEMLPKIETSITKNEILTMVPQMVKMNISKSFGWPYQTVGKDYYGTPKTLESNVIKLHQEVYGQSNYEASDTVKTIRRV